MRDRGESRLAPKRLVRTKMVPGSIAAALGPPGTKTIGSGSATPDDARAIATAMRISAWKPELPLAVVSAVLRNHEETAVHPDAGREPLRAGRGLDEPCVPATVRSLVCVLVP